MYHAYMRLAVSDAWLTDQQTRALQRDSSAESAIGSQLWRR
jgi:hypothetical protein